MFHFDIKKFQNSFKKAILFQKFMEMNIQWNRQLTTCIQFKNTTLKLPRQFKLKFIEINRRSFKKLMSLILK